MKILTTDPNTDHIFAFEHRDAIYEWLSTRDHRE